MGWLVGLNLFYYYNHKDWAQGQKLISPFLYTKLDKFIIFKCISKCKILWSSIVVAKTFNWQLTHLLKINWILNIILTITLMEVCHQWNHYAYVANYMHYSFIFIANCLDLRFLNLGLWDLWYSKFKETNQKRELQIHVHIL